MERAESTHRGAPTMSATPSRRDGMGPISGRLTGLPGDDWRAYRQATARYEAAWSDSAEPPAIEDFLPTPGHEPLRSLLLLHLIKEEYERRHGEDPTVAIARYLDRFPELCDDPPAVEELRAWERTMAGSASVETQTIAPPALPDGYRFLRELARGGMSRLFLVAGRDGAREVLKQVDPMRTDGGADLERFENEIKQAGGLAARGVG